MFDLIFSGISAYNQVGMFIGALVCLGLGGLILGDALYWRIHSLRVSGTIIGVMKNGGMYTPVYRYALADGKTYEAKSDVSTGSPDGYQTGRSVPLLVSPDDPSKAQASNSYVLDIIGLVLLAPGVWLLYMAVTAYPITRMTWIMAAAMLLYFAERSRALFKSGGPTLALRAWKSLRDLPASSSTVDLSKVTPAEQFQATANTPPVLTQLKQKRLSLPIVALFTVIAAFVAIYQGRAVVRLEEHGVRAMGQVVDLKEEESSGSGGGYVYYPIVQFSDQEGRAIRFKDNVGSNPPTHRPGDQVRVLFLADDERQAVIDRGLWNWTIPVIFGLGAILLAWLFVAIWSKTPLTSGASIVPSGGPPPTPANAL